ELGTFQVIAFYTTSAAQSCGENETYDKCANGCYNTCKEPMKSCPRNCGPGGCRCKVGFVREHEGGRCILYNQCSKN
ncbi:trypsin Inhibitor like cysteine rich domain protein, partial [Oesophagostomum dentatum]